MLDDEADFADDNGLSELYARPLRRKAADLLRTVRALVELADVPAPAAAPAALSDAKRLAGAGAHFLLENGYLLNAKLAAARGLSDYGQLMEVAVLVKRAAGELQSYANLLRPLSHVPG